MSTKAVKARMKRGPVYSCSHCDYRGDKAMMTSHHVKRHLEEEEVPFRCSLCGYRSNKVDLMGRHMNDRHKGQALHANLSGTLEHYSLKKSDAVTLSAEEALGFYEGRQQRARSSSTESLARTPSSRPTTPYSTSKSTVEESVAAVKDLISANPGLFDKFRSDAQVEEPTGTKIESVWDKIIKMPLPDVYAVEPLVDLFAPEEEICDLVEGTQKLSAAEEARSGAKSSLKTKKRKDEKPRDNLTNQTEKQAKADIKPVKTVPMDAQHNGEAMVAVDSFSLEDIAVFIESTVRSTVDSVASAIVVAARKHPLPPEQDLRPLTNHLVLINSHLGEVASQLANFNSKQSEMCEILSSLNKTLSTFGTQTSRLNRGVATITTAAEKIDANLSAQSVTLKALVQWNIDSNASVATALQNQTQSLNTVISKANSALKPTTGPVSGMVQEILHLEKEKPEEKPAENFKIPMRSVIMSKTKFVAASPRRPEFVEQMKAIRKRRLLASVPTAPIAKKPREL